LGLESEERVRNLMGKRKERRYAAMNSTGRRVKLDLFAEPSGDLGGSDVRDGVEREQTELNELPNSPSSSGGFHQLSSKSAM